MHPTSHPAWTNGLHHDGSASYVSNPTPSYGELVQISVRVPADAPISTVWLRTTPDGEQHYQKMRLLEIPPQSACAYWTCEVPITMPLTTYRFRVMSSEGVYWLNALGISRAEGLDLFDFKLIANLQAPVWLRSAVFYQIFPDRFYNGDPSNDVPDGAWELDGHRTQRRAWGEPPLTWAEGGCLDFYGGDLDGIAQKLDYLDDLGVNALYLTPIFTAYTNHRYDVADYKQIDPYLGGDAALARLRSGLDAHAMRLVLDITPNHCGLRNVWFTAAQADPHAPTAEFFTFHEHPHRYATWLNVKTLVKLNYRSQKLRQALYRDADSPFRRWLRPPYRIDGWRLDVANMTARQGEAQLAGEVWRELRAAVKGDNPNAYILAENFYDCTPHLQGDELDGNMNYRGFTWPLWDWLRPPTDSASTPAAWLDPHPAPAEAVAEQWRVFRAALPWAIARQQFNLLGSHDTPRALWIFGGDAAKLRVALAVLMTYPGVPCVYYGDEVGMTGGADPDNRRCMRWDGNGWDTDLRAYYQAWIARRKTSSALLDGGYQDVYAAGDWLAFVRQSSQQRLLTVAHRGGEAATQGIALGNAGYLDGQILRDLQTGVVYTVTDGAVTLTGGAGAVAWVLEG